MTDPHDYILNIFGFPVRFLGLSRHALVARMGSVVDFEPETQYPVLTFKFVPTLRQFEKQGFKEDSPVRLLAIGFAYDFQRKTVYYRRRAKIYREVVDGQSAHYLLERAVAFCIALQSELYGHLPLPGNVLYLHASVIATSKGALVFCGQSTFGKSTISGKLLKGYAKIEDDQALVRMSVKNNWRPEVIVFSPRLRAKRKRLYCGCSTPRVLPIAAIFWLKKSPHFEIKPMKSADFASLIYAPMHYWRQPRAVANRLAMLRKLVSTVPCAELSFAKQSKPLIGMLKKHGYI